jgi:hypothetical protein
MTDYVLITGNATLIQTYGAPFGGGPKRDKLDIAIFVLLFFPALIWPGVARAAGFFLSEIGTPDMGLASTGPAARAQDASTVFTNAVLKSETYALKKYL